MGQKFQSLEESRNVQRPRSYEHDKKAEDNSLNNINRENN